MKKLTSIFIIVPLLLGIYGYAQTPRGFKGGDYNKDNYPENKEISFVWNDRNPKEKSKGDFTLKEEGEEVKDFEFRRVTNVPDRKKTILFLWEDIASHHPQSDFTRRLLSDFFDGNLDSGDQFNIAVFNRHVSGEVFLELKFDNFTSNREILLEAVRKHEKSTRPFSSLPKTTDLYAAVSDGFKLLEKKPVANIGAMVVITAGLNFHGSGGTPDPPSDLGSEIPVYIIRYPFDGDTSPKGIYRTADQTFGDRVTTTDSNIALATLREFYQNMNKRQYGHDYQITWTTKATNDGKSNDITLTVVGSKTEKLPSLVIQKPDPVQTGGRSLKEWIEDNLIPVIAAGASLLVLIVVIVLLIVRNNKKQKKAALKAQKDAIDARKRADEAKADHDRYVKGQEAKEEDKRNKEIEEQKRAEVERLTDLMRAKNLYPRLQCMLGNERLNYTVGKPVTTIGSKDHNDLTLQRPTVSREHALLEFNGAGFEIVDNNSKNKVIVNGQIVQSANLRNGDKICLGEVIIIFYI